MKLEISSINRINAGGENSIHVQVVQRNDTESGATDVVVEVEIKDIDFMSKTISEIESIAISRAEAVIG